MNIQMIILAEPVLVFSANFQVLFYQGSALHKADQSNVAIFQPKQWTKIVKAKMTGHFLPEFRFGHWGPCCLLPLSNRVRGGSGRSIPRQDSTKTQFSFSFAFCVLVELLGFDCWDWFSPFDWLSADRLSVWGLFSLTKAWITSFTDVLRVKFWTSFSSLPIYIDTEPN